MCHEMPFYHGGYYLIKIRPINFGSQVAKRVFTSSTCVNDGLLDPWCYSWTTNNNARIDEIKDDFQIDDEKIQLIRRWVDQAFDEKRIGWCNLFNDLETVHEYSQTFFSHLPDKQIISVYFSESETADLLSEFKTEKEGFGSIGLYDSLLKRVSENSSAGETFIGFDVVGIEYGGGYHTFYCHDISNDLVERFGLTLNQYGLFDDSPNWQPVTDYMNAEENGFEPVPWFVCKTKLVNCNNDPIDEPGKPLY